MEELQRDLDECAWMGAGEDEGGEGTLEDCLEVACMRRCLILSSACSL